jgi:hypothetical protein
MRADERYLFKSVCRMCTYQMIGYRLANSSTEHVEWGSSMSGTLHIPVLLAQRTSIILFRPQRHAAIVKAVIAFAPHHHTVVLFVLCLTSQTRICEYSVTPSTPLHPHYYPLIVPGIWHTCHTLHPTPTSPPHSIASMQTVIGRRCCHRLQPSPPASAGRAFCSVRVCLGKWGACGMVGTATNRRQCPWRQYCASHRQCCRSPDRSYSRAHSERAVFV